ncbi:MAG: energy transducer TonB [Acidobacteriota bacterium]|nr:energy transducer TonB [Acidobacteriota bacterium]MDQ5836129.1 energy transducer TonB [Acidobacteriota bacterium]
MFSCLLKRVLPFTLTFMLGAFVGGLFKARSSGPVMWTWPYSNAAPLLGHEGPFGYGHSCRMRSRYLVAETRPLLIRFKPDAILPPGLGPQGWSIGTMSVHVTFGADGKVQRVAPLESPGFGGDAKEEKRGRRETAIWDAVERAARGIQFEPEMINSVPVTVTREIDIYLLSKEDDVGSN